MKHPLDEITLVKTLAPEEICPGDYVVLMEKMYELPSFLWNTDSAMTSREELVRLRCLPPEDEGIPLKVKSVCLPYVLVAHPRQLRKLIDIRRTKLARLNRSFGKQSWRLFKAQLTKQKKESRQFFRSLHRSP